MSSEFRPKVRLDSWKEIAAYLDREVSTVRRWEKEEGLPVHRHTHSKQATVYAYPSEIEAWLQKRGTGLSLGRLAHWRWAIAGSTLMAVAALGGIAFWNSNGLEPRPLRKFVITPPSTAPLANTAETELAISPDGRHIVYRGVWEGKTQLYLRSMDELGARPIPGSEGARGAPFFSPDGEWLVFAAEHKLKKASLAGGAPITLCDAPVVMGGSWNSDGTILFAAGTRGLYRIAVDGGEPEQLAAPDPELGETLYYQPQILPRGNTVLFNLTVHGRFQAEALFLDTGERKVVLKNAKQVRYLSSGHLLYSLPGTATLMAVPFDLAKLEVSGEAVPILEGVRQRLHAGVDFHVSDDGTLVYVPTVQSDARLLVWVDRQGAERLVTSEKRNFRAARISPDGKRIVLTIFEEDGGGNVWIYDLARDSFARLTFEGERHSDPVWSPDGKWITFTSDRDSGFGLYREPADRSGSAERLPIVGEHTANSWSPDGSLLAVTVSGHVGVLQIEGDKKPQIFSASGSECCAAFSPDGQWLAYVSDELGRNHVYVRQYPKSEAKWLISDQESGDQPVWSPDGRELFYRSGDKLMVVSVETQPEFSASGPKMLFEGSYARHGMLRGMQYYDISPDGQHFLMIKEDERETGQINVVLNWFEELKRLVPTSP